ncbi:hypothetical protein SESBI_26042 [Sesbania bispinosa]|nr:hypothetical protein SESBI_26042 [Sesbania bispinosa]
MHQEAQRVGVTRVGETRARVVLRLVRGNKTVTYPLPHQPDHEEGLAGEWEDCKGCQGHNAGMASEKCQKEKRKTISGDDLLWAMATLGFEDYIEPLKVYLARYRELEGDTKGSARSGDGSGRRDQVGLAGQNAQV